MDDLERSSKRQHSKTPAATALRKHDIIWFNDGNIVLQAEQMQFLVHRSVLALHSVVFKDMFSLPPPPIPANETKLEELHPTVQMHDSAVDVENMLSALYGQSSYMLGNRLSFSSTKSLLRIGAKYMIQVVPLQEEAKRLLLEMFPSKDFKSVHNLVASPAGTDEFSMIHNPSVVVDALNLAEATSFWPIAPAAFYCLRALCSLRMVLEGVPRVDGSKAFLTASNQKRWLISREEFMAGAKSVVFGWLRYDRLDDCLGDESCKAGRYEVALGLDDTNDLAKALGPWKERWDGVEVCLVCTANAKSFHDRHREYLWSKLPGYYEIPE